MIIIICAENQSNMHDHNANYMRLVRLNSHFEVLKNARLINSKAFFIYNLPAYLADLLSNSFKASDLISISNGQNR